MNYPINKFTKKPSFFERNPTLIKFSVILVIFLVIGKKLLGSARGWLADLGILKQPDQLAIERQKDNGVIQMVGTSEEQIKKQYAEQASTKSDAEWLAIAATIRNDLSNRDMLGISTNDTEDAGAQLCRVQNDTDVYKLIQAFGRHTNDVFWIFRTESWDLHQFVNAYLSKAKIAAIHDNYKRKKIKYRW